jgi:hypothetical protein
MARAKVTNIPSKTKLKLANVTTLEELGELVYVNGLDSKQIRKQWLDKLPIHKLDLPEDFYIKIEKAVSLLNRLINEGKVSFSNKSQIKSDYLKAQKILEQMTKATDAAGTVYKVANLTFNDIQSLSRLFNLHIELATGTNKPGQQAASSALVLKDREAVSKAISDSDINSEFQDLNFIDVGHKNFSVSAIRFMAVSRYLQKHGDSATASKFNELAAINLALDNISNNELKAITSLTSREEQLLMALKTGTVEPRLGLIKRTIANAGKPEAITKLEIEVEFEDANKNKITGSLLSTLGSKFKLGKLLKNSYDTMVKDLTGAFNRNKKIEEAALALSGSPPVITILAQMVEEKFLYNKVLLNKSWRGKETVKKKSSPTGKYNKKRKQVRAATPRIQDKSGKFVSRVNIQALVNARLHDEIRSNMAGSNDSTNGPLRYQSGRFAKSVTVTNVGNTRGNSIHVYYRYMNNPYSVFAKGGDLYTPQRDVNTLIDRSIREIAQEIVLNKFKITTQEV